MLVIRRMWFILWRPRRTGQEITHDENIWPALGLVGIFAVVLGLAYLATYFAKAFPPPPADWQVWLDTWGEAFMNPFLPIPLESYRLFLAVAIIPGVIGLWLVMGGIGRLFSQAFHGKASFQQYLSLFGFSFFPFWIIAALIDFLYMGLAGPYIVPALNMAYGPAVRTIVYLMPLALYPLLLGLGGVYIAVSTYTLERFAAWKCALVGLVNAGSGIAVLSLLVR